MLDKRAIKMNESLPSSKENNEVLLRRLAYYAIISQLGTHFSFKERKMGLETHEI